MSSVMLLDERGELERLLSERRPPMSPASRPAEWMRVADDDEEEDDLYGEDDLGFDEIDEEDDDDELDLDDEELEELDEDLDEDDDEA